jgi:tol-pal system protein YbgF
MNRTAPALRAGALRAVPIALCLFLAACPLTERPLVEPTGQKETLPEQVTRLEQLVARLEAESKQARTPDPQVARRVADLGNDVQGVTGRLTALEGRTEAVEKALSAAKDTKDAKDAGATQRLDDLDGRLAAMDKRLADLRKDVKELAEARAAPVAATAPASEKGGPAPKAAEPQATGQSLYDEAYALYKNQKKYEEARAKFRAFIEADPGADLAANAAFWIGETFFGQKQYEQAILEYDRVVQKYPKSDKVPSALLKQAFAFGEIGDPEDARILLKKILREFPQTDQARLAKKKLEALGE